MIPQTFKATLHHYGNRIELFAPNSPGVLGELHGANVLVTIERAPVEKEKTPGQVAYAARRDISYLHGWDLLEEPMKKLWEESAQAVLDWDAERRRKVVKDI